MDTVENNSNNITNSHNSNNITNITNSNESRTGKIQWNLEPNHSHYLIIDDGSRYNHSLRDFRTDLCVELNHSNDDNEFLSESIYLTGSVRRFLDSGIDLILH